MSKDLDVLEEFLNMSVFSADPVFEKFQTDENGRIFNVNGNKCYFKPGTRNDRILIIAHADTVWDERYGRFTNYIFDEDKKSKTKGKKVKIEQKPVKQTESYMYSDSNEIGIGADDRAGAAIAWLLKDSGNSILITDKEEIGAHSARSLIEDKNFREIIKSHRFILQFDLKGDKNFKCYNVGSRDFKTMLEFRTKYKMLPNSSFTDVAILGKDICGANFSVGYYHEHTPNEYIDKKQWLNTLKVARKLSRMRHQQFYTDPNFSKTFDEESFQQYLNNRKKGINASENFEVFDNISIAKREYGLEEDEEMEILDFEEENGIEME